jgi:hypothetical protein
MTMSHEYDTSMRMMRSKRKGNRTTTKKEIDAAAELDKIVKGSGR